MRSSSPHSIDLQRRLAGHVGISGALALLCGPAVSAPALSVAPDFTLRSIGGPNLRLQEQRGKVVLINFWATWCAPCRLEMPHLDRLFDKYRATGFVMLGVNVDDDAGKAIGLASRAGWKFPLLLDTDKTVSRLYDISTMPTSVLVDRDGRVRHVHNGYTPGLEEVYERQVRELLK